MSLCGLLVSVFLSSCVNCAKFEGEKKEREEVSSLVIYRSAVNVRLACCVNAGDKESSWIAFSEMFVLATE